MCDGGGNMSPASHLPRESQIDLPESDDTNWLQTHFKHFLFAVPHEQAWNGEEFGRSHSPELSTLGVEFLATFNLFVPILRMGSLFAYKMKEQGKGRNIGEKYQW